MRLWLYSDTEQRAAPMAAGYAFRRGDIPSGASVACDLGDLQVTPKNYWPDGSLKFALLAALVDLPAATPVAMNLRRVFGRAESLNVEIGDLKRAGITLEVACGSFGTVRWSGNDWDNAFQRWATGPVMSSWVYRSPVGSDPHLVVWLEVRVFSGGQVEVLPWIENGYVSVAGPTNKNATYTVKLNNAERFSAEINLRHHQRTVLVSGSALSHWNVADPQILLQHDAKYLMATELVPTYSAVVSPAAPIVVDLPTRYVPLQQGSFRYAYTDPNPNTGFDRDNMATGGYGAPIGLLPQHDMLYVTTTANVFASVVRNGYSAGRYHIHYRDEATNQPIRFSQHPNLVLGQGSAFSSRGSSSTGTLTPTATGGNGATWDTAHSPSVGYMAYLLTGRWYFMEQVQFAATVNYLGNGNQAGLRNGSQGLVQPNVGSWQTRAAAWQWRTLVQALTVTPDSDTTLRGEFINSIEANIANFHGRYVAQANNPFGFIQSGSDAYDGGTSTVPPWQQDFVTAVFGYAVSMNLPIGSTSKANLSAFFQWMAKSVVGRLSAAGGTGANGFPYMNAAMYVISLSSTAVPNYTTGSGPWRADWAEVFSVRASTLAAARAPGAWINETPGTLYGEIMPGANSLWGNLMPAISYAVRHGVPGALDGYNRIIEASNFAALASQFNTVPVWSVKPSSGLDPAWLAGSSLNEWFAIPGTTGAGGTAVNAFSGFVVRDDTGELFIAAAGGHLDSSDNRVVSLDLRLDSPSWVLRGETPAAALDGNASDAAARLQNVSHYADGRPTSRHNYRHNHWLPHIGRIMLVGCRGEFAATTVSFRTVDGFNPATNRWDAAGTYSPIPGAGDYGEVRDGSNNVWTPQWKRYKVDGTWDAPATTGTSAPSVRSPMVYDPVRNSLVCFQWADGFGSGAAQINCTRLNLTTMVRSVITINASAARTQFEADRPEYAGADYCPDNDKILFYSGLGTTAGRMYWLTPNTGAAWDLEIATFGPGSATLPATANGGVNGRLRYVPTLKGFVLMPSAGAGLYFLRTSL